MVEWTKAPHWKCGVGQLTEGSNPSLSAIFILNKNKNGERSRPPSPKAMAGQARLHFTEPSGSTSHLHAATAALH